MNSKEKRLVKKRHKKKSITSDSSDSDEGETHELYYYANDRIQLMKEVLKILKSKKIKSMAPPSIRKLPSEEINAMLLEELIGISNKRLKKILDGQDAEDESSSSSEDLQGIDVISLDDVSDEDFIIIDDDSNSKTNNKKKKHKKVKSEKVDKKPENKNGPKTSTDIPQGDNEKLLSVLEILELQARARAIRSQLLLEAENKAKEAEEAKKAKAQDEESDGDEAIIVETPEVNEIVISSGEEENEKTEVNASPQKKKQKIVLRRNFIENINNDENVASISNKAPVMDNVPTLIISEIPLPDCVDNSSDKNISDTNNPIISESNNNNSTIDDSSKDNAHKSKDNSDKFNNSTNDSSKNFKLDKSTDSDKNSTEISDTNNESKENDKNSSQIEVCNKENTVTELLDIGRNIEQPESLIDGNLDKTVEVNNKDLEEQESNDFPKNSNSSKNGETTKIAPKVKKANSIQVLNIVNIVKHDTSSKPKEESTVSDAHNDEVIVIHLDSEDIEGIED